MSLVGVKQGLSGFRTKPAEVGGKVEDRYSQGFHSYGNFASKDVLKPGRQALRRFHVGAAWHQHQG